MYAEFADALDVELNRSLQALAAALRARRPPWIRDVVPALCGIALHFDPDHAALPASILERTENLLEECAGAAAKFEDRGRILTVPVCYDREFGLDLPDVSRGTSLSIEEIVQRHRGSEHYVLMVGFFPGQPYIGGLDARLAVPRRATPRTHVPAGSVAIANSQSTVYPYQTPGGWNVIGRTPLAVFDPARETPSLFAPGDRVRFVPIARGEFERLQGN